MMMNNDKFGVVLILPQCAFSAELQRGTLSETLQKIDDKLTEEGAPEEPEMRCELMMDNALALSDMIANREVEHDKAISDIAFCFIYAFAKSIGFEQIDGIRGLTGSYLRDTCLLNPCLSDIDYKQESDFLCRKMADHEESGDEEWDVDLSIPPTLH